MKFLGSQLGLLFATRDMRSNLRALARYLLLLTAVIVLYAVLFHVIMERAEGQRHSWITGFYWTLTVMTTLGFGDITFQTDVGRLFSLIVLISGVVLLLVLLPFLFISLFYAPWLEGQLRRRAPRSVPAGTTGHVVIARHDEIAAGVLARLALDGISGFVIEPDPVVASQLVNEDVPAINGEIDSSATYEAVAVHGAGLVLANDLDTTNTNITLTVREVDARVPVVAIVEHEDSVDVLQLAGATHVLPLKHQLGEYLANRVTAGRLEAHVIGTYQGLQIAELPVRHTPFSGVEVRDTRLRETTGVNIVGIWERGQLAPAYPHTRIADSAVMVVAGSAAQVAALNARLPDGAISNAPVLVIGAGTVGMAAARALRRRGIPVHLLDRDPALQGHVEHAADKYFAGDAADRRVLERAGLDVAPSVLLTTNDDATNIYLAVYCRKLKGDLRIVSRITHDRNLEAIHRAGADFVLSYASLGTIAVLSLFKRQDIVILGEGVNLVTMPLPRSLAGRTLRETGIGSRTGLSVIAVRRDGQLVTQLDAGMQLSEGAQLVMLGSLDQRRAFIEAFGS